MKTVAAHIEQTGNGIFTADMRLDALRYRRLKAIAEASDRVGTL